MGFEPVRAVGPWWGALVPGRDLESTSGVQGNGHRWVGGSHIPWPPCSVGKHSPGQPLLRSELPSEVEVGGSFEPGAVCSSFLYFAHICTNMTVT